MVSRLPFTRITQLVLVATLTLAPAADAQVAYQKPAKPILDVLHAPLPPNIVVAPTHDRLILATPVRYPPISDLAAPMLRLGGVRFVRQNRALHAAPYWADYTVVKVADGTELKVPTPAGAHLSVPTWSADGTRFAFGNTTPAGIELWVAQVGAKVTAKRLGKVYLNPILGHALDWMPDQKTLLVKVIPSNGGAAPADGPPKGPNVQEASGEKGPSSTYEIRDVLKSGHDEDLFDYYGTSQLALVSVDSAKVTPLGKPALYTDVTPAPDGAHLLIESIHRPYSYITTYDHFPTDVVVWNKAGQEVQKVAQLPLANSVPIWGVPTGPRDFSWRATAPATLVWAEAQDGGDWNTKVPHRDIVKWQAAPFDQPATELTRTEQRYAGIWWSEAGGLALITEQDLIKHWTKTLAFVPDDAKVPSRVIWDRSTDERYKHPGTPVMKVLPSGYPVIQQTGDTMHLSGVGASPEGDRPFLDRFDIAKLSSERLFRSDTVGYEQFVAWIDLTKGQFMTRAESQVEAPNLFRRTLGAAAEKPAAGEPAFTSTKEAITHLTDPTPVVRQITKKLVKYKRADGVDLSFTLYLPPGYKEGTRVPAVLWAYPLDFTDASMAGQVVGSPRRFTTMGWPLHLFFLLDGYAVIDNPSMPVVGPANTIYDTYMEQLVAGAKAAVDKAVELGVVDRDRIGVTGHSHGGLMTVNLLAHSDLFRSGIARSGAYNRSLTAFGFQNERRTVWQARDVYMKVSPFFSADKVKSPLLLIHGEADANPGTTPLQSEKLFEGIRGTGGTVRLLMLPFESHHYASMESTEHVLYEMLAWFEKYVKNAAPREAKK